MNATFVTEVRVTDPQSRLPVWVAIYREAAGGMFGIDSSFIENEMDEHDTVASVFDNGRVTLDNSFVGNPISIRRSRS